MANVYSVLSMSSVATVLMAGNVQAQSIPPEGPVSVIFTATPIPAPSRCRSASAEVCPREPSTRHLFVRQQTAVINSI
jgi:hypothetical protein